eukprot:7390935-Alexandrium_andersonii.AAC.1
MDVLAAERAKEAELIALLVEHQVQTSACVSLTDTCAAMLGGGDSAIFEALWCRVRFDGCQFGL